MKKPPAKIQLGKQGITDNFIEGLGKTFKNRDSVRISLLRAFSRDREEIKKTADEICSKLKSIGNFKYTIIGFTIIMRRGKQKNGKNNIV